MALLHHRHLNLLLAAALVIVVAACGKDHDDAGREATDGSSEESPPPSEAEQQTQDESELPTVEDLEDVDRDDPSAVAAAWGCGYWAHPRGEGAEQLAERLAPLSTGEIQAAVAELRVSGLDSDTVEVIPGTVEQGTADTWTVNCVTVTTGADAAPVGSPTPVTIVVGLTEAPDGWLVAQATLPGSGLTLP